MGSFGEWMITDVPFLTYMFWAYMHPKACLVLGGMVPTGISCFLMVHPKACLDIGFHIQGGIFSLILLLLQRISFLKSGR